MSANNTLEVDDGNSDVNGESLPTTTSVLDKSRSLFGNSSSVLSKPVKETTPDRNEGESSVGTEPSVAMEKQEPAGDTISIEEERVSAGAAPIEEDESMDTTEPQEPPKPDSVDEVKESFEKKTISMDTSDAAEDNMDDEPQEIEEEEQDEDMEKEEDKEEGKVGEEVKVDEEEGNDDEEAEEEKMGAEVEGEEEEEDEEEEVPKKKAKRTAISDEEEEDKTDEQSGEASSGDQVASSESNIQSSPVKPSGASSPAPLQESSPASSQKVVAEQSNGGKEDVPDVSTEQTEEGDNTESAAPVEEEEEVEAAEETVPTEDQEDDDTAGTTPAEEEEGDETAEAAPVAEGDADEVAEAAAVEDQEAAEDDNEAVETGDELTIAEEEPTSSTRSGRARRTSTSAPTPTSTSTPRRGRGRQSTVKTPAEETKKEETPARRGRASRGAEKKEEPVAQEEPEEQEEEVQEEAPQETPRRGRGRRSVAAKQKQEPEELAEEPEAEAEVEPEPEPVEEETPKKRGRGRRSAAAKEEVEEASEEAPEEAPEVEQVEEETPRRGRGRRSVAAASTDTPSSSANSAPRSARGRGRKPKVDIDEEPAVEEKQQEEGEEEANGTTEKQKTPRGRKSAAKQPEAEEEEAPETPVDDKDVPTSSRRSARSTKGVSKPHPVTPAVTNKRTPARGRKKEKSVTEETIDEVEEPVETPSPPKRGRGASSRSGPSSSKKAGDHDPYDMDTEMEHHPEPLKKIHFQMEVQNFGTVKYASSGAESKYSVFESIAESRIGDLPSSSSSSNNRRSLADMTPGKEKQKPKGTPGRKPRAKKEEAHQNDVEMEEAAPAEASEAPTSSNRGRKRKSEASELTTPPAKREQHIELRELDCEEQLRVDHPQDDNEAHAPGARVYAIYQKAFYPAVILAERDGLGRYKLQFLADKLVKDVPNSGIIPLRALIPGKIAIYNEEDVRLEAIPNDISASEWAKGKVTISTLDEEGESTDDVKTVEWKDISFDQSEWRDYIKSLDQNATAIVTSNITTIAEASRARKPVVVVAPQKPKAKPVPRKKKEVEVVPESRGASMTPAEDDDDRVLPMKEEAIGQNIFSGKVFMLTSANRSGPQNVSSMFKKKNLITFITDNGGIVTEQLNYFQESHADLVPLLISDTYYRTHKYLAALARGIPCVSNLWLQECAEQGECVDYEGFILPAGASIFESDTDMPAPKNPSELLKGKAIYVHSTHTARENTQLGPGGTFIEIWKPILEMLGATVIECDWATLDEIELKFDVALVDGTFREEVMSYADKIGAGKVTSEWVIQTIILGKAPDPTAHSKFDPYRLHHRTRY